MTATRKLLTTKQAAELIGVKLTKMYQLVESKQVPHIRIPSYPGSDKGKILIDEVDLLAWLDGLKTSSVSS